MAVRHACSTTLVSNCASAQARHFGRQSGLVYKDQLFWIEIELAIEPARRRFRTSSRSCSNACADFFNVHPRRRSQAPSALRLMPTCRSTHRRSTISSSVTSLRSSIISTTNASWASSSRTFANLAAVMSVHHRWPLRSSGLPSKSQPQTGRQPTVQTCQPQTLSIRVTEDHRSVLVPSSTSSLWMLNQLRRATSPHNRFINRRICSSRVVSP